VLLAKSNETVSFSEKKAERFEPSIKPGCRLELSM